MCVLWFSKVHLEKKEASTVFELYNVKISVNSKTLNPKPLT